jgi:hypothetical protein
MTIEELTNRPKAYYNIDGVGELEMSFFWLGFALILWVQAHTPGGSLWHQPLIYFALLIAILHYGSRAIKAHVTYPRTGFVEYRKGDRLWARIMGVVAGALAVIAIVVVIRSHWENAALTLYGLLFAAGYAWRIARTAPWKWGVVCLLATGSMAIPALPADLPGSRVLLLLLFGGATLAVSGGISLWLYIRHTQAPARDAA